MRKIPRILLCQSQGFTLIEVMVGAFAISALALFIAKMVENLKRVERTVSTDAQILEFVRTVQLNFADRDNCTQNFVTSPPSAPTLKNGTKLVMKDGTTPVIDLALNDTEYRKMALRVDSIILNHPVPASNYAEIILQFTKLNKAALGVKTIKKVIRLQLELDASNNFLSCFSLTSSAVRTTIREAVKRACVNAGLKYDETDIDAPKCVLDVDQVPDVKCATGEYLSGMVLKEIGGIFRYEKDCKKISDPVCGADQWAIIDGNQLVCKNKCPAGQVGFYHGTSGFVCMDLLCPTGPTTVEYLTAINATAVPPVKVCRTIVRSDQPRCANGFHLVANNAGQVEAVCSP